MLQCVFIVVFEGCMAALTVYRARSLLVGERVVLVNQIKGFLTEFGIVLPQSRSHVRSKLPDTLEGADNNVPHLAH